MATLTTPIEQRVILSDISWETYERLLAEIPESTSLRLYYDRGDLEIIVLSPEHERFKHALVTLIDVFEDVSGIPIDPVGSMTCRRRDVKRGFEADASYYIQNAQQVKGKRTISFPEDPPPDLVIEIDIAGSSMRKLSIFAGLGVPEVWRWRSERFFMCVLSGSEYVSVEESHALPGVKHEDVQRIILASQVEPRAAWKRSVRAWAETVRG